MDVRPYREDDVAALAAIWNEIVEDGRAFPQTDPLTVEEAARFFGEQTYVGVAEERIAENDARGNGENEGSEVGGESPTQILGLSILHPNNVGRCSHIANASYAVARDARNKGVGRALVSDSLAQLAPCGFRGLQFNAVVASNHGAMHLYEDLGFTRVGVIPQGFLNKLGDYEDIFIYYHEAIA